MNISPIAAALKGLRLAVIWSTPGRASFSAWVGVRALDRDHRQVAARREGEAHAPVGVHFLHPGEVLFGGAGVDHQAEPVLVHEIDDEVVDDAAGLVQHAGIQRLAGDLQLVDVVGHQPAQEGADVGATDVDRQHVRDVEQAAARTHRVVFLDLRAVVDRHVPAAEVDHLGAEFAMGGVERGLFESGLIGHGAPKIKKGEARIRFTPLSLVPERLRPEPGLNRR
jgi:hypothetical protein